MILRKLVKEFKKGAYPVTINSIKNDRLSIWQIGLKVLINKKQF